MMHDLNYWNLTFHERLSWWLSGKESACQRERCRTHGFSRCIRKIPGKRAWQPTPVFLLGKSHVQRSLVGYSPWGGKRVRHDLSTKQQWQPGFQRGAHHSLTHKKGSLCLHCANHMVYAEHLISFPESGIWIHTMHRGPSWKRIWSIRDSNSLTSRITW